MVPFVLNERIQGNCYIRYMATLLEKIQVLR